MRLGCYWMILTHIYPCFNERKGGTVQRNPLCIMIFIAVCMQLNGCGDDDDVLPDSGQTDTNDDPAMDTDTDFNPGTDTVTDGASDSDTDADMDTDTDIDTDWEAEQTVCDNEIGSQGGYTYEYWKDQGNGCMNLGPGGAFSIEWKNINNLLARKGVRPGSMNQIITYGADYQPNGNSYLCSYGWTTGPLVEYYIVDSWGSWRPPGGSPIGTVSSDGGKYDIYRTERVNQPSIQGTATFSQYWSVRKEQRESGTITVANHFYAWENAGMNMGNLYEVSMCVEGYRSSGAANVYSLSIK